MTLRALVLVIPLVGCGSSTMGRPLTTIGALAATVGGYLYLQSVCFDECRPQTDDVSTAIRAPLFFGGLALTLVGLVIGGVHGDGVTQAANAEAERARAETTSQAATSEAEHERARQLAVQLAQTRLRDAATARDLFGQARTAAHDGDCIVARQLADQIAKLDPDLHRNVMVHDPEIATCLAAP